MMPPAMHKLELDITYTCGMGCHNCNRMTGVAPPRPGQIVTVEQIERLIDQSVRLCWPWREWFLLGGEPTLHPDLDAIIARIAAHCQRHNPRLQVTLCTHGNGVQGRLDELTAAFPFLQVLNSHKDGFIQPGFIAACMAPVDVDPQWAASHAQPEGCIVSWHCGLGLNYKGFYPCAIAAAIDRVFGFDEAVADLAAVTVESMRAKYAVFCKLCGHYCPTPAGGQPMISPTWRAALDKYAACR